MNSADCTRKISNAITELTEIVENLTKARGEIEAGKCPPIYGDPAKPGECIFDFNFDEFDDVVQAFADWIRGAGDRMAPPKEPR